MADRIPKELRSKIMSKIRSKNTSIEVLVFRYLKKEKIYFRKHYRTKQGISIDIALPRKKKAVFIDGEFWHGRYYETRKEKLPEYWVSKIKRNMERDKEYNNILANEGWSVLRVWEDDIIKHPNKPLEMIKNFLTT